MLIFSTIEDESKLSGFKITNSFGQIVSSVKKSLSSEQGISFTNGFNETLNKDITALTNYKNALDNGILSAEAFENEMKVASVAAQEYAKNTTDLALFNVAGFATSQKREEITSLAQVKSIGNIKTLINEYNSALTETSNGITSCGLKQTDFVDSVGKSNSVLGKYLTGLNGANASMKGYIGTLIASKAATLGLRIATTALNAVIGMGIGLLVSWAMSGIATIIENIKESCDNTEEKISELNSKLQEASETTKTIAKEFQNLKSSTSEIAPKFIKLSKGVDEFGNNIGLSNDEYEEFWKLNNQLAEMFPDIDLGLDSNGNHMLSLSYSASTLTDSLKALLEIEREAANKKILEGMDEAIETSAELKKKENVSKTDFKEAKQAVDDLKNYYLELKTAGIDEKEIAKKMMLKASSVSAFLSNFGTQLQNQFRILIQNFSDKNYGVDGVDWNSLVNSDGIDNIIGLIDKEINDLENKSKYRSQKVANIANAYLQTTLDYATTSNELQIGISKIVGGIDFDSLDISTGDELKQYIDDNIINIIKAANPEVQSAIVDLFSLKSKLESGDISPSDYLNQIDKYLKIFKDNGISDDIINAVKYTTNYTQQSDKLSEIERKTDTDRDSWKDMSSEDIEIAYNIVKNKDSITIEELKQQITETKQKAATPIEIKTSIKSLSGIESLSEGFDQLGKIYTDIKDGGDFDWGNILNSDDFEKAFGELDDGGKAYNNFIETISNSPNDIKACQNAFNKLATTYINSSGALDGLTESNRAAASAMLKQMGIANSTEIVDKAIAYNKAKLKYTTNEYANATLEEIQAEYNAATAGTIEQQVLAELTIQKMLANKNTIDSSKDIDNLLSAANAANVTTESFSRFAQARAMLARAEELDLKAQASVWYENTTDAKGNPISIRHENGRDYQIAYESAALLRAEAQKLIDQGVDYNRYIDKDVMVYTGGGSSSKSGSSSDKSSEPDLIDWIEIKINRIKEGIDRLSDKAKSSFKKITDKLKFTNDEIKASFDEISVQQKAYDRYMKEADDVHLSSELKAKVRDGSIDISEYEKSIADAIKDYQDFYEKAIECKDSVDELHESIASLYESNFNAIKDDFDNQLSEIEHIANTYQSELDLIEERGYTASAAYYSKLRDIEKKNISILKDELSALESKFDEAMKSKEIEEYSDAWYSMKNEINSVEEAISEANSKLVEYGNNMRQIKWDMFDFEQDRVDQITQESDFLIDLLSNRELFDDKGQFSEYGLATAGLRMENYNVYMLKAKQYAEELLEINKELANDPYNQNLIERREELLGLQQDLIASAEDEKQAIKDLVSDGINAELDSLKELIDAYTNALDSAKSLSDYQKSISDKTSEISTLKKQLLAYTGDNSEETRATIQKLNADLKKAEEDLQDTEYDRYISDQKELLDNLYTEYETTLNQRLDNIDALISDISYVINSNSNAISETIKSVSDDVGYSISNSLADIWKSDEIQKAITKVIESITDGVKSIMSGDVNGDGNITAADARKALRISARLDSATDYEKAAADINGDGKVTASEARDILRKSARLKSYSTGGLVDYTGIAQVDGTPGKPELVLNATDTQNFLELNDLLKTLSMRELTMQNYGGYGAPVLNNSVSAEVSKMVEKFRTTNSGNSGTTIGDIQINIPIDRVSDYNDFVNQLRNDKKFENMILDVAVGKLSGGNSLAKNKYQW